MRSHGCLEWYFDGQLGTGEIELISCTMHIFHTSQLTPLCWDELVENTTGSFCILKTLSKEEFLKEAWKSS